MTALPIVLVAVATAARAPAAPPPITSTATTIEIRFQPDRLDYFFPAPRQRTVIFALDARNAPPKSRIMFTGPLPSGRHRYRIQILHGGRHRTLTIATPVRPGRSTFDVTVTGAGRLDLGFWSSGWAPREYRFTMRAPARDTTFALDMPSP